MAWLIKRVDHPEINLTDGVFRTAVVDPGVWNEWRTILAVPDPGYVVVSGKLWDSLISSAPPPLPPGPPPASTGVSPGTVLALSTLRRTSQFPAGDIVAQAFVLADDWVIVNRPTTFRDCMFMSTGLVSNSSAIVQNSTDSVVFENCTFDGGPFHNRCIQGDYGDIVVKRCQFTRFGNAAVEKNDRSGTWSMTVEDSYLYGPKGWPRADHADGLQMGAGKNCTIRHNTIHIEPYGATDGDTGYVSNSCIGLWAELGDVTGTVLVENNRMAGGGCVMYCEQKAGYKFKGSVTIRGNVFDRSRFPSLSNRAAIWHVLAPLGLPPVAWSSNTFDDGTAVTLAQAIQ